LELNLDTDKLYYSIGEVSDLFKVNNSLIRYWESEFPQLNPQKNRRGDRKYTKKDIETLQIIHALVKEKGYTIDGAKKALNRERKKLKEKAQLVLQLQKIRTGLLDLKKNL
jgi:DNA-binding transcriptional MerR regulator